jgi:hypothetical protein
MSPEERPDIIMAYFDQPDTVGHFHKTDNEVNLELSYIESVLNYLFTLLHKNNLMDCINVLIMSDHGMQQIKERIYLDSLKLDTTDMIIANGVLNRIYLDKSNRTADSILDDLKCLDKNKFNVYGRENVPSRLHFAATKRVGDVIIEGTAGSTIYE